MRLLAHSATAFACVRAVSQIGLSCAILAITNRELYNVSADRAGEAPTKLRPPSAYLTPAFGVSAAIHPQAGLPPPAH